MKAIHCLKSVLAVSAACLVLLSGCSQDTSRRVTGKNDRKSSVSAEKETRKKDDPTTDTLITDHNWKGVNGGSLLVCETDGSFQYYRSAEDLTDSYYTGSYEYYRGADALAYLTVELSQYAVTAEEMEAYFERNEGSQRTPDNLVCLVLHNEQCIIDGENTMEETVMTPYYGFVLTEEGDTYLDIVNMNSANPHTYMAVDK